MLLIDDYRYIYTLDRLVREAESKKLDLVIGHTGLGVSADGWKLVKQSGMR